MTERDREDGPEYDAALPGESTELAPSSTETEAQTAWALDDGPEWTPPFWTAGRITAVAAAAATVALVVAAGVAGYHLRSDTDVSPPPPIATSAAATTSPSPAAPSPPPAPVPPPTTMTVTVEKPIPIDYDQRFIENLRAEGWNVWDTAIAKHAHTVCQALRNGDTVQSISQQMITVGLLYEHETRPFITTAMNTYPNCP